MFSDTRQTKRNTRRQGSRSDRRTKVRQGAADAVSKNAFAQPLLRLCEILLLIRFFVYQNSVSAFLRCVGLSKSAFIADCNSPNLSHRISLPHSRSQSLRHQFSQSCRPYKDTAFRLKNHLHGPCRISSLYCPYQARSNG